MLLLRDQHRCPSCFTVNVRRDIRQCIKCNAWLVFPGDTASHLTEQIIKHFYFWTHEQGWINSWHLHNKMPNVMP